MIHIRNDIKRVDYNWWDNKRNCECCRSVKLGDKKNGGIVINIEECHDKYKTSYIAYYDNGSTLTVYSIICVYYKNESMIKTLQKYFVYKGWKSSLNAPLKATALGKFAYDVWDNCLSPKVSMEKAIEWLAITKEKINKNKS